MRLCRLPIAWDNQLNDCGRRDLVLRVAFPGVDMGESVESSTTPSRPRAPAGLPGTVVPPAPGPAQGAGNLATDGRTKRAGVAKVDVGSDQEAQRKPKVRLSSRSKGIRGELEVATLIHEHTGVQLVRNLTQTQQGGQDLLVAQNDNSPVAAQIARYAIEVKRHARAPAALVAGWWGQCVSQATAVGRTPALAYRQNRGEWRFLVPMSALMPSLPAWYGIAFTAELSIDGFCVMIREGAERC